MSQLPESNFTQQTHSGTGDNVGQDKNDTSYFSEIGGDFKGIQGDISGGVINQYIITQKSGLEITSQPLIKGSPYLGLRKFEVDDKDKFFGRDRWIIELTNYLAKENVLLLLGASGSGKSSLIQAGLIPKLKDQWGSQLFNFTFVPDVDPFESFYGCLLSKYKQSEAKLARTVKEDTLIQVVQSLKNDAQWLIFIDQFEEVFTRTPKTERDIFIKSLIQLIENSDSSVKVIMTMRADFLDKLSPYHDLGKVHDSSSRMLTDMEDSDLRLAIAEPAARNGVIFEQGLIDTIIADFKQQAGSLPLLQYTLNLLWSKDDITDRILHTKAYQELGGVTGALQQQANKIYDQFDETQRKFAEEIFLELIELVGKEAVSRRADKAIFERDETQREILYQLIDNRLLVSKGEEGKVTVEVAHEELLRSWKVLQDLIREKEDIIILRNRLYADAKQWDEICQQDAKKANSELWNGSKLAKVVRLYNDKLLPNLDALAIKFANASINHQNQLKAIEAERKQREVNTEIGLANSLSQYALLLFNEGKELEACIAIIKAGKILQKHKKTDKNIIHILQNILFNVKEYNRLENHQDGIRDISFTPDGSVLASSSSDKTIKLWDVKTGKEIYTLNGHMDSVKSISFSPDGNLLASGSSDKTIKLWNIKTGQEIYTFNGHLDAVISISFHPNGNLLASGSSDKTIKLWNIETRVEIYTINVDDSNICTICISSDGNILASASHPSEFGEVVKLWNISTKTEIKEIEGYDEDDFIYNVNFSHDGKILALCSHKHIIVWDRETEAQGQIETAHNKEILSLSFSSDGQVLVTGSCDKTIKFWNIKKIFGNDSYRVNPSSSYVTEGDDCCLFTIRAHNKEVSSVCFSPDGKTLASGSFDKTIKLWKIDTKKIQTLNEDDNNEFNIGNNFSSDNNTLEMRQADEINKISDLDFLMTQICNWVHDYLTHNPNVSESDRHLCDDI